jgi:hypothetical protein
MDEPINKPQLFKALENRLTRGDLEHLVKRIEEWKVDFDLTSADEKKIRESQKQLGKRQLDSLIAAVRKSRVQRQESATTRSPDLPVTNVRWVAEPVSSPKEQFPFAVRLTIQSTVSFSPVHFVIECSGILAPAQEQPGPAGISFGVEQTIRGNSYEFRRQNPPITPQEPLIMTILSAERFKVLEVQRVVE